MVICDEGHRLKNMQTALYGALTSLQCKRRIIVSGTPIQNDLTEYYSLLNFVNEDLLGTPNEFRRNFGNPIQRGRDSDASDAEKIKGQEKLNEMGAIVSRFIIRRTSAINKKYLPSKVEQVVFCRMTQYQVDVYKKYLKSGAAKSIMNEDAGGGGGSALSAIISLKKLCNHPALIYDKLKAASDGGGNTGKTKKKSKRDSNSTGM